MRSILRGRLTYANVLATLVLLFAMSGGAYAASKYLITSTKQISPKVLKSLKGKEGAAGAPGAAGAQGPQGPAGKDGVNGKDGTNGTNGTNGVSVTSAKVGAGNRECPEGGSEFKAGSSTTYACNGSPWVAGGVLPHGKSEQGQWKMSDVITKAEVREFMSTSLSFPIPLAAPLAEAHAHYIGQGEGEGEATPAAAITNKECEGTFEKPKAASGNLCVFEAKAIDFKTLMLLPAQAGNIENVEKGEGGAGVSGAVVSILDPLQAATERAEGEIVIDGDWVVTA